MDRLASLLNADSSGDDLQMSWGFQSLIDLFDPNWLRTRSADRLFFVAFLLTLALPILVGMLELFGSPDIEAQHILVRIPFGIAGMLLPLGTFFITVGMWAHWQSMSRTDRRQRRAWLWVLVPGLCFGASLYYWCVYRKALRGTLGSSQQEEADDRDGLARRAVRLLLRIVVLGWAALLVGLAIRWFAGIGDLPAQAVLILNGYILVLMLLTALLAVLGPLLAQSQSRR